MDAATISTRTLEIDGMCGDACVQKVTGALKNVHGVSTQSVKVGSATIGADQNGSNAACKAINGAGFKAHEGACTGQANASKTIAANSAAGQSTSSPQNSPIAASSACSSDGAKGSCENASAKPLAARV